MGDVSLYMTAKQAAEELGVSKARVSQLIAAKRLKVAETLGGVRLLLRTDVAAAKAFIRGKAGRPPNPKPDPPAPKKPRKKSQ